MRKIILGIVVLVLLGGCGSFFRDGKIRRAVEGFDYELLIHPNYETQKFELELKSLTDRRMYVSEHNWPNKLGQLHFPGRDIYVLVGEEKYYYLEPRNFGYCVPGCSTNVDPGGTLKGFILFSEFSNEAFREENVERNLVFSIPTYFSEDYEIY